MTGDSSGGDPDGMSCASRSADSSDLAMGAVVLARRQHREVDVVVLIGKSA
ncbi:MAG: hypothetical protein H0W43_03485 [Chthoniobacterales bacterium]|nr:hypothetical protein [Chthoniobacterales bacterium]